MTQATKAIGLDGKGGGGMPGFFEGVGRKNPEVLATLTARAMPGF